MPATQHKTEHLRAARRQPPARIYVAQTGLIGGDFPNHKTRDDASAATRELKPTAPTS